MNEVLKGITLYLDALQLANKYRLWRFIWIPIFISLLVFTLFLYLHLLALKPLSQLFSKFWPFVFGSEWIGTVSLFLSFLLLVSFSFFIFKYVVLICTFPFMSFVSQKLENKLYPNQIKSTSLIYLRQFFYEVGRGVMFTARIIWIEILILIPLYLLSLIPGFIFFTTAAILVIQATFAGFCNMDYTLERYMSISTSWQCMKDHRLLAFSNGFVFLLLLSIPLLGIFIAPILGTIAAALGLFPIIKSDKTLNQ